MTTPVTPAEGRIEGLRPIRLALIVLCAGLAFNVGLGAWSFFRISEVANDSNRALCALRGDLEVRVAGSQKFLREHPEGIPGISAKVIRDGITNQQRTIKALSSLSCDS